MRDRLTDQDALVEVSKIVIAISRSGRAGSMKDIATAISQTSRFLFPSNRYGPNQHNDYDSLLAMEARALLLIAREYAPPEFGNVFGEDEDDGFQPIPPPKKAVA
jgi:hypothetical protein